MTDNDKELSGDCLSLATGHNVPLRSMDAEARKSEELSGDCLSLATGNDVPLPSMDAEARKSEEVLAAAASGDAADAGDAVLQDDGKPSSKRAQKRLLKMERYKALKAQRKAFEKTKRHEDTERKRKEWRTKLSLLSVEEQEITLKEQKEKRNARQAKSINRKSRLRHAMENGQNLVIDLEFCDRMKPNELASLVQQVMYSYSANAKATVPARLSLTGCTGEVLCLLQKLSGFENWLLHKEEQSYLEVFKDKKQDLIYLTADSNDVVEQLDGSKIYIIGGLVDRNRWKGLTLEKAKSQGISTAKLPINEHVKLTSSAVLTVNQVVETFLLFSETKNWERALQRAIPSRKRSSEDVHGDLNDMPPKIHHHDKGCMDDGNQDCHDDI